jgi:hypothetical protein
MRGGDENCFVGKEGFLKACEIVAGGELPELRALNPPASFLKKEFLFLKRLKK